jgi:hypothetical protein
LSKSVNDAPVVSPLTVPPIEKLAGGGGGEVAVPDEPSPQAVNPALKLKLQNHAILARIDVLLEGSG